MYMSKQKVINDDMVKVMVASRNSAYFVLRLFLKYCNMFLCQQSIDIYPKFGKKVREDKQAFLSD